MMRKWLSSALLLGCFSASAQDIFTLSSPDFTDNAMLEVKFAGNTASNASCTGENVSPALSWHYAPDGTKSFALILFDHEGARGLGVTHLVAYNIPFQRSSFVQGELTEGKGYTGGKNTHGTLRYSGPCPPAGSGAHHYVFTLIATDLQANALPTGLTHGALLTQLKGHTLGAVSLIGRYGN